MSVRPYRDFDRHRSRKIRVGAVEVGGRRGTHQVYLSGVTDHPIKDAALVEQKAAKIEAEQAEPPIAAAS